MSVEERKFVWANFARSTLAEGVSADATELRIRALDASLFPSPDYDEVFSVVLWSEDLESFEVVYCTGRAGDLLTVERGKEGTTPRAFAAGALVVHQVTAGFFAAVQDRRYTVILSSRLYPYELVEELGVGGAFRRGAYWPVVAEELSVGGAFLGGELDSILGEYTDWPPEEIEVSGVLLGGTLDEILKEYEDWPPEEIEVSGVFLGGVLEVPEVPLVVYETWPVEELEISGTFLGGTLSS